MKKIAVSACLLGTDCKYNGGNNKNEAVLNFCKNYEIIPICPESFGGMSTPRIPSEIKDKRVINKIGEDVTDFFNLGANRCLDIILKNDIKIVILKEYSPSCGKNYVYDGTFTNNKIPGSGIFTQLLKEHNITIYTEKEIEQMEGK